MTERKRGRARTPTAPDLSRSRRHLIRRYAALARARQLLALGAFAARLSHLLRSPVSGVLLSLLNLRAEVLTPDQDERLGLAIGELKRIGHLLSGIQEPSRPTPKRPRVLDQHGLANEIAALSVHHLADGQTLVTELPSGLRCRLPEMGLRIALFDLILTAAEALADRPGTIRLNGVHRGDRVEIAVSSDTPGYPSMQLRTGPLEYETWPPGAGSLGLAAVQRFADDNAGRLQLSKAGDGGSCARLDFPLEDSDG